MGRKSRAKKERRDEGDGPLGRLIADYSTDSMAALVDAASVSPTAAHRGLSLALLFESVIKRRATGEGVATAASLVGAIEAIATTHSHLRQLEDFQPYDGRAEVLVRWGPDLFRLLPGPMERPTAMVNQHSYLAEVLDEVLVPRLGFGLGDVGELILRRIDQVAGGLAPVWPDGPAADVDDPATVTQAEVDAAAAIPPIVDLIEQCRRPQAASAVLRRYTVNARAAVADIRHPLATFGPNLATRVGGRTIALPAGLLLEVLPAIANDLAAQAMQLDGMVDNTWRRYVNNRVGLLFKGAGFRIEGPVKVDKQSPIHSLVWFDDRRVLAIDLAPSLEAARRQQLLNEGGLRLARVRPGATVENRIATHTIPGDAEILRLQVHAGPQNAPQLGFLVPAVGLDDLEWILYSSLRSRDDLWFFIRDLTSTPGIRSLAGWDLIDKWQAWHTDKAFYRGATNVDLMSFEPHTAVAEWENAAEAAPAERALLQLGLRPLRDWPCVDLDLNGGFEVGDLATGECIQIHPWSVPTAVDKTDQSTPNEHWQTRWRFAIGVECKLEYASKAYLAAATASGLRNIRIGLRFEDREDGPVLTVHNVNESGRLTIGWDARLQHALASNSFEVEALAGRLVAELFAQPHRQAFIEAWDVAPPGIRVDGFSVRQRATGLSDPLTAHNTLHTDVLRDLATALRDGGVPSGVREGMSATKLESGQAFPWLLERFHETIASFDYPDLLHFAMVQLESAGHQRFMYDKRLGWERGFPVRRGDDGVDKRLTITKANRVLSFIVEEVMARPPGGDATVNRTSWASVLAVAELCIESCFRSDAIFRNLQNTSVELTDLFEIAVHETDDATDVDMRGYSLARAAATMPSAVPITPGQDVATDDDSAGDEPRSMLELLPKLADIDAAMRESLGFGLDALTGVLNVGTQWDATTAAPISLATPEEIADECIELTTGATREEYLAAVEWLTLRSVQLRGETILHWETERRARRIAVCPLVEADDGHVWVLPWTIESTTRILANYLADGRLPWPESALSKPVNRVLNTYRQMQNRELERECAAALAGTGFVVRAGVKPEKRSHYGLANLSGEIDALCLDPARSRIWVIETKDPFIPFSPRQVRRLINDFHHPNGYVDTLLTKVADVEASAHQIADAFGVENPSRAWEIIPLVVTRRVDPAAFAVDPRVAFCVVDDVLQVVDHDGAVDPGFHQPAN